MKVGMSDPRGEIQYLIDTVAKLAPNLAPELAPRQFQDLSLHDLCESSSLDKVLSKHKAAYTESSDPELVLTTECDLDSLELRVVAAQVCLKPRISRSSYA